MDDRLPSQLSGGQQQRIAVARALAHRPQVLLMDEPFGALDAKIREELRRTIRQIQRELGMTTILVTHDQEEAFALADRIGVMHQGRLLECGRPDDLYVRPQTRFVSTFLGAANLLLGYRMSGGVRFNAQVAQGQAVPREVVAVLRPEEVELSSGEAHVRSNFVGHGAGGGGVVLGRGRAAARADGGRRSRARRARSRRPDRGRLVARGFAHAAGAARFPGRRRPARRRRRAARARVADADLEFHRRGRRRSRRRASCAIRRCWRRSARACRRASPRGSAGANGRRRACPPWQPGPGSAQAAEWLLNHGAAQLLCVPPTAALPAHVVIHTLDADARRATVPVAASLLRHVAAEAVYLGIHPTISLETDRAAYMRDLLDARSAALADHGLDMRTELRFGDTAAELQRELAAHENSMLVLGTSDPARIDWAWLGSLLERQPDRPVLIVNAQPDRSPER